MADEGGKRDRTDPQAVPSDGGADDSPGPDGWEALADLTGGLAPDEIPELVNVRELESVYPLLHALVGRSLGDFLVRSAAIESIVTADHAVLTPADLAERLYWLDGAARDSAVTALRRSGWLEHDPSAGGTSVTDAGRWAYDVLAFLHKRLRESEILPTLAGIEYALRIGIDPLRHLLSMRARLVKLREDIEAARASHSEVVIRRAVARLGDVIDLSGQIRVVLDGIPLDNVAARRVVREIHDLLSRLHGAGSELHRDVTEIGRQYIRSTGGLTAREIVEALMQISRDELAAAGREALMPVLAPPPLLTTEVVASAAEQQALRDRPEAVPVEWVEPPAAPRSTGMAGAPEDVLALIVDLEGVARGSEPVSLARIVPRGSAGESFLRLSLISLVGDPRAGEGIAARLGAIPVDVEPSGDGWPEALESGPISRLTPGEVRPRAQGGGDDG